MEKIFVRGTQGATLGGIIGGAIGTIFTASLALVAAPVTVPAMAAIAVGAAAAGGTSSAAAGALIWGGGGTKGRRGGTNFDKKNKKKKKSPKADKLPDCKTFVSSPMQIPASFMVFEFSPQAWLIN